MAASPPGSGIGSSPATRSNDASSQRRSSPPQIVPSVPSAGAVEDERQRRPSFAVLGEAGGGVCVVVLNLDDREVLLVRPLRREVLRMEVAGDQLRANAEHVEVELEIVDECAIRRLGVEVAEVRREERALARGDAEGGLELRAGGYERLRRRERQRRGREPARPPDRKAAADDGVLAAPVDRPVVREECVRDAGEPAAGLVVMKGDRLVGEVSARHHERTAEVAIEEVVERRIREHHAEPRRRGGDGLGDEGSRHAAEQDDRALPRPEQPELRLVHVDEEPRLARHHGERLRLAVLSRTQPGDGGFVGRVARQVVAAEALHRHDPALVERRDRLLERHRQSRPTDGAGDRLRVEAAVERILVLTTALVAQGEAGHRRVGTVVGNAADDREARPALRAVDEGVAEAAVGRVEELTQAVVAGGDVRWDQRAVPRGDALDDPELGLAERRDRLGSHSTDGRE